jgi:hypothetical protein
VCRSLVKHQTATLAAACHALHLWNAMAAPPLMSAAAPHHHRGTRISAGGNRAFNRCVDSAGAGTSAPPVGISTDVDPNESLVSAIVSAGSPQQPPKRTPPVRIQVANVAHYDAHPTPRRLLAAGHQSGRYTARGGARGDPDGLNTSPFTRRRSPPPQVSFLVAVGISFFSSGGERAGYRSRAPACQRIRPWDDAAEALRDHRGPHGCSSDAPLL